MYSNATAARTTRRKRTMSGVVRRSGSGVFQHDLQDDVSRVAAAVDHLFEQLIDVAQKEDVLRVVIAVVKIAQEIELELVGVAFDRLETIVLLARARRVDAIAEIFHHCENAL